MKKVNQKYIFHKIGERGFLLFLKGPKIRHCNVFGSIKHKIITCIVVEVLLWTVIAKTDILTKLTDDDIQTVALLRQKIYHYIRRDCSSTLPAQIVFFLKYGISGNFQEYTGYFSSCVNGRSNMVILHHHITSLICNICDTSVVRQGTKLTKEIIAL